MLKVVFITQEDPIYISSFWEEFTKHRLTLRENGVSVNALVSLVPLGRDSKTALFRRIYGFYGFFDTLRIARKYTVSMLNRKTTKHFAETLGAEFQYVENIHSREFIRFARKQDVAISVAASRIFRGKLLSAPRYGCVNIHSSMLPKYQGMMPVYWQMRDGFEEIGITIHKMIEKLDSGDILMQRSVSIGECRTLDHAILKTKTQGARMMVDFLLDFSRYYNDPKECDVSEATYFSFPDRESTKKFFATGKKLV
jgi:methionyl-tRNA formyltransferase